MSNLDFQLFESYLFSENKQDFIKKLVPGTEAHYFFSLLHSLTTTNKLDGATEKQASEYVNRFGNDSAQEMQIHALLKKYDDPATSRKDKDDIIERLAREYLYLNFDYSKPSDIATSALHSGSQGNSTLNANSVTLESQVGGVYNNIHEFSLVQPEAYTKLDTQKIVNGDINVFERFIFAAEPTDFEDFPQLVTELMKKKNRQQVNYISGLLTKFSKEQLIDLAKRNPSFTGDSEFVQALCKKEFEITSLHNIGTDLLKQERRDLLFKFYNWVKNQQTAFPSLASNTLYEILQLDLELNKFDKDLFIEYLKNPIRYYTYMTEAKQKALQIRQRDERAINFAQERIALDTLTRTYLEEFFKTAKDTKPFNEYFESPFLDRIFHATKLMEGQPLEGREALTPEELKELSERKELTICKYNNEYYKTGDAVKIALTIKNIPSLMVKVFEFKSENYYLKEKKQLDGSINLDGLIAAEEYNYDYSESSIRRFTKEFTFDTISNKKQGIFIIDFIGNGLSSRAVIRKGKLAFVEYQTLAGQLFEIVDDATNVCQGKHTGIWIRDRFYKTDDKGRVLIPYSSNRAEQAVLVHDNLAELVSLSLKEESFDFKCSYIYNYESFLMGNKAKVLVQPRLFINAQPTSLDVIQSCNAIVTTLNDENIPTRSTFNNLKLSGSEELELEFTVPAKLKEVSIQFTAKILPVNKREPKEYTSSHSIPINLHNSGTEFCNLYLRYTSNGYEVALLGKNGEPKQGLTVNLTFRNRYINKNFYQSLQTDQNGRIYLGKLEEITVVEADLQTLGDIHASRKSWKINNQKKLNYPNHVRICEGDSITLPLNHNELNRHKIVFNRVLHGDVLNNELKALKIDKRRLIISGLKEGSYRLRLKDVGQDITITVYKGTYWTADKNFLYANHTLIDIKQDIDNIVITDVKVQPKQNSELADVSIEAYVDQPERARFHVFAAQFLDVDMTKAVDDLNNNLPSHRQREAFLGLRGSQFINNRTLGDEYTYVLDRKNQARFMGNTLEKPQLLIKKTFVRDTQTTEEQLAATQQFAGVASNEMAKRAAYGGMDRAVGGAVPMASMARREMAGPPQPVRPQGDSFMNFLANPCLVYSNLKAEKGIITLKDFPYKKYSLLQIVGSNLSSNVSEIVPLETKDIQVKDLAQKVRESNSVFSVSRVSNSLPKGEKIKIKDLTSTEIQVIDTLSKLFNAQKNLALGSQDPNNGETYDTWDFLKEWNTLSAEEKLKKYDKFASHELNVFVYFKDTEFFNKVVLPFLQNKMEKTMIDYFLLNDTNKLAEYAKIESFQQLNSLEQILVIISTQKSNASQAQNLAKSLENSYALNKTDSQRFNRCFDTVLLSKKVEEEMLPPPQLYAMECAEEKCMDYAECEEAAPRSFGAARMMLASTESAAPRMKMAKRMMAVKEEEEVDGGAREFLEKRAKVQAGFQELEKTKEYTERHYYNRVDKQLYIPLNTFWVDAAKHIVDNGLTKPLISANVIFAHSNHTEMIAALALVSLPFKAGNHAHLPYEGRGLELTAESDLIVFSKAVTEAESQISEEILIRQRFFDPQDRYTESEDEPGVSVEKEVDQYIINKVYGSTVIVTNSSASAQQFQVLVEVPEGSLPISSLDYTKSHTLQLSAFSTQTIESFFYFPKPGQFKVIPPNVSKKGKVVAVGKKTEIEVKTEKTYTSLETLTAILTKGSKDDILQFVRTKNIWNPKVFDFYAVYWLLVDKDFFLKFIEILRERKYFDHTTWQFGFYHKDEQTVKEYFVAAPDNSISCRFSYLSSTLLKVDKLNLLEYNPFVNQRVHGLKDTKNRILNVQLKEQYKSFLTYLCERNNLETKHSLGLIYYLLLQDRVQDAIKVYSKIDREEVRKSQQYELQYDYFSAYLDFYIGAPNFGVAREVCKKYLNYPVLSWRGLFTEVASQLAEYDGADVVKNESAFSEEKKQNLENADKEETVNLEVHQGKLHISHQNISEITLAFYRIDLEVLFSRNPFINQSKDEFSFIQPNETRTINIANPRTLEKSVFEIPESLRKYNLYIELRTDNKTLSTTYFSTSLHVQVIESYGQVKVLDKEDKPLTRVYVKCFAKAKGGKVSFYKDGYTDLRGRFDYATLNSSDISNIERFAIFVMSDELGSLTKEANPPSKLGRIEN